MQRKKKKRSYIMTLWLSVLQVLDFWEFVFLDFPEIGPFIVNIDKAT